MITFVNSTAIYIITFIMMFFANRLVNIFTARIFDIPAVLYSYRIFWPLYTYSTLYTRLALIVIFAAGPLTSLALAIVFYRIFLWARKFRINFKTFIVWSIFQGINMFFGAYISGVITRTGFVYTTEWIFFSSIFDVEEILFMIISVLAMIISGYFLTRQFITSAVTSRLIYPANRIYFILGQLVLPWLTGNLILFAINFPRNPPELLLLYAVSFLILIPVITTYNTPSNQVIKLPVSREKVSTGWIYILAGILLLYMMRTVLFGGISFS